MTLSKAFLHLDGALRYPDPSWKQEMVHLPALAPSPGSRRDSSRLAGPWMVLLVGPASVGKTTLYKTRLSRLFPGIDFLNEQQTHSPGDIALPRYPGSGRFDELIEQKQDFICELDLPDNPSDWPVDQWKRSGYHTALVTLSFFEAQAIANRVEPGQLAAAMSSNLRDVPKFMAHNTSRFHASWWLDCSGQLAPPNLLSRWVDGKLVL